MSDKKYFVLLNSDGTDSDHVFVSKQPRGAALKAATRGHTSIELRRGGPTGSTVSQDQSQWWTDQLLACMAPCEDQESQRKEVGYKAPLSVSPLLMSDTRNTSEGVRALGGNKNDYFLSPIFFAIIAIGS